MSDEPSKKARKRPESAMLERLQAELSAGLKTGEDPLYYDWTRVAEAPPSEAAYAPPMQVHTQAMDTRDLAAIIGSDAAEAARHAPNAEHKVMIDEPGKRAAYTPEMDPFGDAIPTEKMPGGPVSDDRYAVTRRLADVGQRSRNGWFWIACAIVAVLGCAAFMWTQRGSDHVTRADVAPQSELGSSTEAERPPIPEPPPSALAPSTAPLEPPISEPLVDPVAQKPPSGISSPTGSSLHVQRPEQLPPRRSLGANRSRPSSPQPVQPKAKGNDIADPMFTDKPDF
jgi:hypothetical protein